MLKLNKKWRGKERKRERWKGEEKEASYANLMNEFIYRPDCVGLESSVAPA